MPESATSADDIDPKACRSAWFITLDRALDDGDYARAAEAQRELRRLGVDVRIGASRRHRDGGAERGSQ